MTAGPGKYDDACTAARESTGAAAVVLIVVNGKKGSGMSVQAEGADLGALLPVLLRNIADQLDEDLKANG